MGSLPYVTAAGNVERALLAIKSAATPETVSQDFVKTILKIRGGSGNQITSYLKKVGFANADGTPSSIYKQFRNTATSGRAAAAALKFGYGPLFKRNEFAHELSDEELRGLIIEETGQGDDSQVPSCILSCFKAIKKFAQFNGDPNLESEQVPPDTEKKHSADPKLPSLPSASIRSSRVLPLSYTINLNLPATSDPAVFNAIFKSLKEHLLEETEN